MSRPFRRDVSREWPATNSPIRPDRDTAKNDLTAHEEDRLDKATAMLLHRSLAAPAGDFRKSAMLVLATVAVGVALRHLVPILSVTSLFLLPVVVSAIRWGLGPSLFATVLGIVAGTLFYEPVLSVQVWTQRDIIDLCVFAVVGTGAAVLGDGLRRSSSALRSQEQDLRRLYALSREVAAARDAASILSVVAAHLSRALGHDLTVVAHDPAARPEGAPSLPPAVRQGIPSAKPGEKPETTLLRTSVDGTWLVTAIGQSSGAVLAIAARLDDADADDDQSLQQVRSMIEEGATSLDRLGIAQAFAERQLRDKADEVRSALLDAASHELRTPLATVLGAVSVLAETPAVVADQRLAQLSNLAAEECRRLDRVIQTILDAGRVRSGALLAHISAVDVSDLAHGAAEHSRLRLRDHRLDVHLPEDLPLVRTDPVLIEQALVNLLENAAKFSPAGSTIVLEAALSADNVELRVIDAGIGFTEDERGRLFDRFYRGGRDGSPGGSGLGLSVARAFVEASGGSISAASAGPGAGATMTIALPQMAGEQGPEDDD
jgi:two-component system sensor histidine kinase KdpD